MLVYSLACMRLLESSCASHAFHRFTVHCQGVVMCACQVEHLYFVPSFVCVSIAYAAEHPSLKSTSMDYPVRASFSNAILMNNPFLACLK